MRIDIYNDDISYVTDEVSSVPTYLANLNEENREKFVTDLAAVSRGKHESNNPSNRYRSLLTEAACETPSRPLEFLPVITKFKYVTNYINTLQQDVKIETRKDNILLTMEDFLNKVAKFSYIENDTIYTNMRCLLNAGMEYEEVPYADEKDPRPYKNFKAIRARIPMFVWAQVPNTHTQISKEAQSDRITGNENYWLPNDILERLITYKVEERDLSSIGKNESSMDVAINTLLHIQKEVQEFPKTEGKIAYLKNQFEVFIPQRIVQYILQTLGYKREIWSRAMYYFKYKECVMTGWYNDPNVWQHLFIERSVKPDIWKNWTQPDTKLFVKAIRDIVES